MNEIEECSTTEHGTEDMTIGTDYCTNTNHGSEESSENEWNDKDNEIEGRDHYFKSKDVENNNDKEKDVSNDIPDVLGDNVMHMVGLSGVPKGKKKHSIMSQLY